MNLDVQPDPLLIGGNATITITGGTPHTTVTVQIENADTPPETDSVDVQLDANGNGTGTWPVNSTWTEADFWAPGVPESVARRITAGIG